MCSTCRLAATTAAKEMSESLNEGTRQSYNELQREYSEALSHFEKDLKERDEVGTSIRDTSWWGFIV